MENFVVSARKYRPHNFEEVVGQDHITSTLKNAIDNNQLAQAMLFCGPRGVGKTTCARILAKKINDFDDDDHPHLNIFELDAASNNSVEDIRNLIDQVRYPPQQGKYKVYIIDEVHMLSNAAFNAFLKTLEEPPGYAIFILATTEKQKVIPTILSRCQIFDFSRIGESDIVTHLKGVAEKEGIKAEQEALHVMAQKSDGALRDALSLFDLIATFSSGKKITYKNTIENLHILDYDYYFKMTDELWDENSAKALLIFDEIIRSGFDGHNFISGLGQHFRNLMVCQDPSTIKLLEITENAQKRYLEQAQKVSPSFLLSGLNIVNHCDINYKSSKNPRLLVELTLMKIAHLNQALNISQDLPEKESKKKITDSDAKPDTDTPEIAPVTKQLEKKKEPEPEPDLKPDPAPFVSKSIKIPRIKKVLQTRKELVVDQPEEKKEKEVVPEYKPIAEDQNYDPEELKKVWKQYGEKAKKAGRDSEFTILNQEMEVEDHIIQVKLRSPLQKDILERFRADLLQHLRQSLQNRKINIKTTLVKDEKQKVIYTTQEKYDHLVKKNPKLENLKDKFGLDTEF